MNRKTIILLVAMVATILPAVAVADVMVQGNVQVEATGGSAAFMVTQGSNYAAAQDLMTKGSIWTSTQKSATEQMGTMALPTMTNETLYGVNILQVNFLADEISSADFYINISVSTAFVSGTYLYISGSPMSLSALSSPTVLTAGSPVSVAAGAHTVYSVSLSTTTSTTLFSLEYTAVSSSAGSHVYIGFETTPPGSASLSGLAQIAFNYIA